MTRDQLVIELVAANHVLASKGILDAFGHVSVRVSADRVLLARNLAPAQVVPDSIFEYDLSGACIAEAAPKAYLERFIHCEIYRARPDVCAVIHSHTVSFLPFSVVPSVSLQPMTHMSGFLHPAVPVFDTRVPGCDAPDLLIRTSELGCELAARLGSSAVVLMRGHGATIVGPDLPRAVLRAVYTDINARVQLSALALGQPIALTESEANACQAVNDAQVERPWQMWRQEVT
jgi:ribulose-5-phosphate 4-epimerase/fuculose-1-phosphate aldolase